MEVSIYFALHFALAALLIWWGHRVFIKDGNSITLAHLIGVVATLIFPWLIGIVAGIVWLADNAENIKIITWKDKAVEDKRSEVERACDSIIAELTSRDPKYGKQ